jgi:lipopolysaccharide/colanic/teichoic acid biosynthesis glycosyltransferase
LTASDHIDDLAGALPLAGPGADLFTRSGETEVALTTPRARVLKRSLDLLGVLPLLLLLLAVTPFVALAILTTSRGPVLFRHTRTARDGRPFTMLKFRTMHTDAEERLERDPELLAAYLANDFKVPLRMDPRVTRVGRVLRKYSLDELPQALNVLRGDMSLVGPRPIVAAQVRDLYGDDQDAYLLCKPGLTGQWQVSGRSSVVSDDRASLDREYVEGWTLHGDILILLKTIPTVLSTHGAH